MKRYFTSNSQQRFSNKNNNVIREISLLLLFIFSFTATDLYSQQKDFQLGFTFTPHQTCRIIDSVHYEYWQHYNWYSELKLNLWQGAAAGSNLQYHLTSLDSLQHYGMQGYYQPDTLMYAAFGKVSIHQAEETSDRYRYKNHHNSGTDVTDNWQGQTQRVRYYEAIPTGPYTSVPILTELNENAENSYSGVTMDPIYQPIINDSNGARIVNNYYVKPRMRISTQDAFGTEKPVVKIIVNKFDGLPLKTITLTTNDFRYYDDNTYDGRYLEDYFITNLKIRGDSLNVGRVGGYLEWTNIDSCHVDYQIYWYQEVSVWIDYVKIMDEPANLLFNPDERIRKAIKDKVKSLLDYDGSIPNIKGFFTEETDYSRLTCLKYLQDFLKDSIPGYPNGSRAKMICLFNPWSFEANMRERGKDYDVGSYLDTVKPDALFFAWYPFQGPSGDFKPVIPDNVTIQFKSSYTPQRIQESVTNYYNTMKKSPAAYTDSLQRIWNVMTDTLKNMVSIGNLKNVDLYFVSQVHNFKNGPYPSAQREPMNSEISAMNCLGLCYGIKGLMPYDFITVYSITNEGSQINYNYTFGMLDSLVELTNVGQLWEAKEKRIMNFYGENKWEGVKLLNQKINKWGSIIANSINTKGFSVNRDSANHNFISDIKSIYSTAIPPFSIPSVDNDIIKYWEMGFFYPDYLDANDKSKYFIMANRRCVPNISNDGDLRQLKIKFDSTQLSGFRNWKIIEMDSNNVVRSFDKDSNLYIDMGIYQPGEGKLYKLAPVMQEGGTLVADEEVNGIQFVCKDEINNNGKNIRLSAGTSIQFNEDAGINMTGGNFICSNSNLSGSDTSIWNGIFLNNTGIDSIVNCTFSDAKTSVLILNDTGYFFTSRVIKNNVFNVPSGSGNNGIYGENNFRITIQDNTFNMPYNPDDRHIGVYLKNNNTTGVENLPEENEPAPNFRMFLIHNTFNNGTVSAMLMNYTSSYYHFM